MITGQSLVYFVEALLIVWGAGTLCFWGFEKFRKTAKAAGGNGDGTAFPRLEGWAATKRQLAGFLLFFLANTFVAQGGALFLCKQFFAENHALFSAFVMQAFSLALLVAALKFVPAIFPKFSWRENFKIHSFGDGLKIVQFFAVALLTVLVFSQISQAFLQFLKILFPSLGTSLEQDQALVQAFNAGGSVAGTLLASFSAVFLTPIIEEIFFRFALYRFFKNLFSNGVWASLVTGLFFAVLHDSPVAWLPLVALNCILCFAYEKTGRLVSAVVVHGLFNANTLLLIFFRN
ncbi:MAG: CPBP family intramembrane metalloprotease [Opitutales bacterium]|nr:CPBP family intramembrane metalloprotease [Opitutales bacterium]